MLPKYIDVKDSIPETLDMETIRLNSENEWFDFIQNGNKKTPYLKEVKKLKKKPKIIHSSAKQRSVHDGE